MAASLNGSVAKAGRPAAAKLDPLVVALSTNRRPGVPVRVARPHTVPWLVVRALGTHGEVVAHTHAVALASSVGLLPRHGGGVADNSGLLDLLSAAATEQLAAVRRTTTPTTPARATVASSFQKVVLHARRPRLLVAELNPGIEAVASVGHPFITGLEPRDGALARPIGTKAAVVAEAETVGVAGLLGITPRDARGADSREENLVLVVLGASETGGSTTNALDNSLAGAAGPSVGTAGSTSTARTARPTFATAGAARTSIATTSTGAARGSAGTTPTAGTVLARRTTTSSGTTAARLAVATGCAGPTWLSVTTGRTARAPATRAPFGTRRARASRRSVTARCATRSWASA
mmetsp:Transcript_17796/g.41898  ORF Transcript_17796/g.41898 Transcript_17796/m.41898 type:complete len:350 (+) Transcript_17796:785-1834(+)